MKVLLFLFLPFIVFNSVSDDYTINLLINYLKENGFYEIIENVKIIFGTDFAIELCIEFTKISYSKNCKEVVTDYMETSSKSRERRTDFESEEETEEEKKTET